MQQSGVSALKFSKPTLRLLKNASDPLGYQPKRKYKSSITYFFNLDHREEGIFLYIEGTITTLCIYSLFGQALLESQDWFGLHISFYLYMRSPDVHDGSPPRLFHFILKKMLVLEN